MDKKVKLSPITPQEVHENNIYGRKAPNKKNYSTGALQPMQLKVINVVNVQSQPPKQETILESIDD